MDDDKTVVEIFSHGGITNVKPPKVKNENESKKNGDNKTNK